MRSLTTAFLFSAINFAAGKSSSPQVPGPLKGQLLSSNYSGSSIPQLQDLDPSPDVSGLQNVLGILQANIGDALSPLYAHQTSFETFSTAQQTTHMQLQAAINQAGKIQAETQSGAQTGGNVIMSVVDAIDVAGQLSTLIQTIVVPLSKVDPSHLQSAQGTAQGALQGAGQHAQADAQNAQKIALNIAKTAQGAAGSVPGNVRTQFNAQMQQSDSLLSTFLELVQHIAGPLGPTMTANVNKQLKDAHVQTLIENMNFKNTAETLGIN